MQSHTSSITTLNNKVSNLSGTVNTHTSNISSLQQTASGLTSTVTSIVSSNYQGQIDSLEDDFNSNKRKINSLSGTVNTINNNYVSSSQLNQTASSITANITSGLNNTGIDITNNNITLMSDKTKVKNSSNGGAAGLEFYDTYGTKQMLISANSSGGIIRFGNYTGSQEMSYINKTQAVFWNSSANKYASIGVNNDTPNIVLYANGEQKLRIYIDSSGNVCLDGTFEHPSNRSKLVVDSSGYLKLA